MGQALAGQISEALKRILERLRASPRAWPRGLRLMTLEGTLRCTYTPLNDSRTHRRHPVRFNAVSSGDLLPSHLLRSPDRQSERSGYAECPAIPRGLILSYILHPKSYILRPKHSHPGEQTAKDPMTSWVSEFLHNHPRLGPRAITERVPFLASPPC